MDMVEIGCEITNNPTGDAGAWYFDQLKRHQTNMVQNRNSFRVRRDTKAGKQSSPCPEGQCDEHVAAHAVLFADVRLKLC